MKKLIPFASLCLCLAMLSGCMLFGSAGQTTDPLPGPSAQTGGDAPESTEIIWVMPSEGQTSQAVTDACNARLSELGVPVSISPVFLPAEGYEEAFAEYAATGEYDILWGGQKLYASLEENPFADIEPYLRGEGNRLFASRPQWLWEAGRGETGIIGVPAINDFFTKYDFVALTANIEAGFTGSEIDAMGQAVTPPVDYFTALASVLEKAAQDEGRIAVQPISPTQIQDWGYDVIAPGIVVPRGAQAPYAPEKYYASEYFAQWSAFAREWYAGGYYPITPISDPDAFADAKWGAMLVESAIPADQRAENAPYYKELMGADATAFYAISPKLSASLCGQSVQFINAASGKTMAAVRLLQAVNEDEALFNLLALGIEGEDYTYDAEGATFLKMEGDTPAYFVDDAVVGNLAISRRQSETYRQNNIIEPLSLDSPSGLAGFEFDPAPVQAQADAVAQVIAQYEARLVYGVMNDVEGVLAAFNTALEEAGLDDVMAEAQSQMKAYFGEDAVTQAAPEPEDGEDDETEG